MLPLKYCTIVQHKRSSNDMVPDKQVLTASGLQLKSPHRSELPASPNYFVQRMLNKCATAEVLRYTTFWQNIFSGDDEAPQRLHNWKPVFSEINT